MMKNLIKYFIRAFSRSNKHFDVHYEKAKKNISNGARITQHRIKLENEQ